jgi:hypothetical protein
VTSRVFSIVALLGAVLAIGPSAACGPDGKIKVTLVVILASEENTKIDPRLKAIAAEVQKLNPNFKGFELKTMTSKSLQTGEKTKFTLIDDKVAHITVQHGADKDNKVGLAVVPPDQGEIIYSTVCGKFLPIVTRCKNKSQQRLIIAVRVQPCQGD